jgi:DNA-binding transcriptional regulator GbsR (MarR family)
VIVPIRAFKDKRLTAGQFRALGIVCSYSNKAGLLWAGLERMGKDLGISKSAMCRYLKALERMGYIKTVYQGFKGERASTRQVIFNPNQTLEETMRQTQTEAPFVVEKREKAARKQARKSQKQAQGMVNVQDVNETSMPIANDVMRLKNKVSASIWQLATQRANSETDYAAIKAAIDKLLR